MNASKSSLQDHPRLPYFESWCLPVPQSHLVQEEHKGILRSSDPLLNFGAPVELPRSMSDFYTHIPCPFSSLHFGKYRTRHLNPLASMSFHPLDNPPSGPQKKNQTTLQEAYKTQSLFWRSGMYVPLDYFYFAWLVENQDYCGEKILETIVGRYKTYHKVTILFADFILAGSNRQRCYIVWERVVTNGEPKSAFKIVHGKPTSCLSLGETILTACVQRSDVVALPMKRKVSTKTDLLQSAKSIGPKTVTCQKSPVSEIDSDTAYRLRFREMCLVGDAETDDLR